MEPAEFVIIEGSSDRTHFKFEKGSSAWEEIRALCFISSGSFDVQATVREGAFGRIVGQTRLTINVPDRGLEVNTRS